MKRRAVGREGWRGRRGILIGAALGAVTALVLGGATLGAGAQEERIFDPQPDPPGRFGLLGIVRGQTIRLNAVNIGDPGVIPPGPCRGTLTFLDVEGNEVAAARVVELQPGKGTFLDLEASAFGDPGRISVRALGDVVCAGNTSPEYTVEVFDTTTGRADYAIPDA